MRSKRTSLKRIEGVCEMVEQMRSIALKQAAARLHEAEAAIVAQRREGDRSGQEARVALAEGDQQRWYLADAGRDSRMRRTGQLEQIIVERRTLKDIAHAEYRASRMKKEQVQCVVEQEELLEQLDSDRMAQAASDDRYLSRLRWTQLNTAKI